MASSSSAGDGKTPNVTLLRFKIDLIQGPGPEGIFLWKSKQPAEKILNAYRHVQISRSSLEKLLLDKLLDQSVKEFENIFITHLEVDQDEWFFRARVIQIVVEPTSNSFPIVGIVLKSSKFKLEVSSKLAKLVKGCEKGRALFRDDFNLDNISASLASFGLGGLSTKAKALFFDGLSGRMVHYSEARRRRLGTVRGIMLHGPPGTGKSLLARNIAKILNVDNPVLVSGPELRTSLYGGSEANIRKLFQAAKTDQENFGFESKIHVIIFDEIDVLVKKRGAGAGPGYSDSELITLLSMIDGARELHNILIIGTTNRLDLIDRAMLREGRMKMVIEVGLPDREGRLQILEVITKEMNAWSLLGADVDLKTIARETDGFSGAALVSVFSRANRRALVKFEHDQLSVQENYDAQVTMDNFMEALATTKEIRSTVLD